MTEWLAAVLEAERRGEPLLAFDLAERGLAEQPENVALRHRAVLALARAGSTEQATQRFAEYGLDAVDDPEVVALRARLEKDVALGSGDRDAALRSAALYERAPGYYPTINAASMRLLGGESSRAHALARRALELVGDEDSYYAAATIAEALVLLGDEAGARAALRRAAERHDGDYGAVASTRRQLRVIGASQALLDELSVPAVVHFCGHRVSRRHPELPADAIAEAVATHPAGAVFGSLASGADILFAECFLAAGAELHVVLPFARDEFIELSVGPEWTERFQRCLDAATSVSYATEDAYLGDDVLFRYAAELAMGLALLRAHHSDTSVCQLAVWDGHPAAGDAGTGIDVETWRKTGQAQSIIPIAGEATAAVASESGRVVRAMLFGDVKGFSALADEQLASFVDHVLGAFATVLARHPVLYSNTWGDGLFAVLPDPVSAARCALELQAAMGAIDLVASGLPAHLELRLGGHAGPIYSRHDPVLGRESFFGSHVARTARIEPITPPGAVYVTEAFAAALDLAGRPGLSSRYVGHVPAAKGYGRLRMYRLRELRAAASSAPAS